jgi:isochorismate pyruvate lyase
MEQIRAEIDRLDAVLVELIAQRYGYVDRAW